MGHGQDAITPRTWACPALRNEISRYAEGHFKVSYRPDDEILVTVGVSEGLDLTLRSLLNPGEKGDVSPAVLCFLCAPRSSSWHAGRACRSAPMRAEPVSRWIAPALAARVAAGFASCCS